MKRDAEGLDSKRVERSEKMCRVSNGFINLIPLIPGLNDINVFSSISVLTDFQIGEPENPAFFDGILIYR